MNTRVPRAHVVERVNEKNGADGVSLRREPWVKGRSSRVYPGQGLEHALSQHRSRDGNRSEP